MKVEIKIENGREVVTDVKTPKISFKVLNAKPNDRLKEAKIWLNGWSHTTLNNIVEYGGEQLKPKTKYAVKVEVVTSGGERAVGESSFYTGKMDEAWQAKWITCGSYNFTEKKTSPKPMLFRRSFSLKKPVARAVVYSTAIGIFKLNLNGEKVGDEFFAPGFTTYEKNLQYTVNDITKMLSDENKIEAVVCGGWAVGAYVMNRKNRITAPKQSLLMEIDIEYADGSRELICTDEQWAVTTDFNLRFSEFYDGEVFDATKTAVNFEWAKATKIPVNPTIEARYGVPVTAHERFKPTVVSKVGEEIIYDFHQNFAGVVKFKVRAKSGQKITLRHAEILNKDKSLNTVFLRSAKCQIVYIAKEGEQEYMPETTYMGFRYVGVSGIDEDDIELEGVALYSDIESLGTFECSNELLNRLQENIVWSGKSNFVDIPTDCPQRDERMGWTGDIAVFAATACYNFDMSRFLDKWLKDLRSEQTKGGGIPNTVPSQGYGFPLTMPKKAIAFWGDACVFVPWAIYNAYGDKSVLEENYATMKKYVKACSFWAKLFSVGKSRYIWNDIPMMQFGDWVAPDIQKMSEWQSRCKWTGTAALAASSSILAKVADILGKREDREKYSHLSSRVADAYCSKLTDGNGKLKNEFQTAYVLPLYFNLFPEKTRKAAAKNLVELIEKNNYCIGTGFPGTPYILFALADNGYIDVAYKMLLNTSCPSWLYEVKVGATTIWERWDALDENGEVAWSEDGTGGMVSFNHYAFGAVGDFLYRRTAGIEPVESGYKRVQIKPVIDGSGISFVNASVQTPYGKVSSKWKIDGENFKIEIEVPFGTEADLILPNGRKKTFGCGIYAAECKI